MMKVITTPMCEDVLRMAGLTDYSVVSPDCIEDADLAILLSETRSDIPKLAVKLNTYTQVYNSILKVCDKFNLEASTDDIRILGECIKHNNDRRDFRKGIKVKVYSNFLTETVLDMGFTVCDEDYDYIVCPDYLLDKVSESGDIISVASHKNVSRGIIDRLNERYDYLERKLCMKH